MPDKKTLYDIVSSKKLYTKSFDEFDQKYSTEEDVDKLFNVLSSKSIYGDTLDAFKSSYFPTLKKKEHSVPDSANGATISGVPSSVSQSTDIPTEIPLNGSKPSVPLPLTDKGLDVYDDDRNKQNELARELSDRLVDYGSAFDSEHQPGDSAHLQTEKDIYQQAQQMGQYAIKDGLPKRSIADRISQAIYAPAFNKGFSDLVISPLAGATDVADRVIDKIYTRLTGEKTPEWLRKGGVFDSIAEFADKEYENRDLPENMASEVIEGTVSTLPLIASMATGQGEVNLLAKAPKTFGKLAKVFAVTKSLSNFKQATDEGKSLTESFGHAAEGGIEGVKEGFTLDAHMLVGGALGKGVSKILAEKGLFGGKTADAVIHALSIGTIFGGTSAGTDLLEGRDINTHEAMKQFGMGLAFEVVPVAKSISKDISESAQRKAINNKAVEVAAVADAASNLNGESALKTLINLPANAVRSIHEGIGESKDQLYASSIEMGAKAYDSKNVNEKKSLYADQLLLKTQGDIKLIGEQVKENRAEVEETIRNSNELTEEQKIDLLDKIDVLATETQTETPVEANIGKTEKEGEHSGGYMPTNDSSVLPLKSETLPDPLSPDANVQKSNSTRPESGIKDIHTDSDYVGYIKDKISRLYETAQKVKDRVVKEFIRPVTKNEAELIKEKTGIEVDEEFEHTIDNSAINHILGKHGKGTEKDKSQLPITKSDIELIPDIIDSYDTIQKRTEEGKPERIVYSKTFDDGTTYYFEEVRTGKKELAAVTMYKKKGTANMNPKESSQKPNAQERVPEANIQKSELTENSEELKRSEPEDLASRYSDEVANPTNLNTAERSIFDSGQFAINRDSYIQNADANTITPAKAKSYFKKGAPSADQLAQEINNRYHDGREVVTPQDIVDFIDRFPDGVNSAVTPKGNPNLRAINEAYIEKTGKGLNRRTAQSVAKSFRVDEQKINKSLDNEQVKLELKGLFGEGDLDTPISERTLDINKLSELMEKDEGIFTIFPGDFKPEQIADIKRYLAHERSKIEQGGHTGTDGETGRLSGRSTGMGEEQSGTGEQRSSGTTGKPVREPKETVADKETTDKKQQDDQDGIGELSTTEVSRKPSKVHERIKPATKKPSTAPKKLNEIIKGVSDKLQSTLIYSKSKGRNTLGTYNPTNTLVKLRRAGDLDTAAHELGHMLDDRFSVYNNISSANKKAIEKELKWFADRGGSNPPSALNASLKQEYLQREGIAEFIRAYVANPAEAKRIAPEFYKHFEASLNKEALDALKEFSDDFLNYTNATAGEQILSNVENSTLPDKKGFKEWLGKFTTEDGEFAVTVLDKFKVAFSDSMQVPKKAFQFIRDLTGMKGILPENNFELLSRVFAGVGGKIQNAVTEGMINGKGERIKAKDGNFMNIKWLLEGLDSSSEKAIRADMDDVIKLLVAQRTTEYAKKFNRGDNLTGIGAGVRADAEVAEGFLKEFENIKNTDPAKYDRLRAAADKYREFADAGLRYALDKGRISQQQYQGIKDGNEYYVSLARTKENAPMDDVVDFINKSGGSISSAKDIIKTAKGGSGMIKNPYLSLLRNTAGLIREADRNEVMFSFIEPLISKRHMGQGAPINLANIARKVEAGEKNTRTIYVDGVKENWQFQKDIYEALTSYGELASEGTLLKIAAAPAALVRSSVTLFPVFAIRNAIRDTTARLILSRNNSGLKELMGGKSDKDLYELYGGSQAGHYLFDKNSYAHSMNDAIKKLTDNGGFVLDPRKMNWRNYQRLLEKGENLNRIAEFKAAYRKAKAEGMDDYNAGLYAAYEARDLMDFAVAGTYMKVINRYFVPFSNAGVQALKRAAISVSENPAGFALRTALYTVLPTLVAKALVYANGDEEEYQQLPDEQRDLFWNFKAPFSDKWISIPKPFELGITSSLMDRLIDKSLGHENAMEGFSGPALSAFMPVDEGAILGPLKPAIETMVNYDTFRKKNIVPKWEDGLMLSLRKGADDGSRLGIAISDAFGVVGSEVDPRKVDHFVRGFTSYYGDWAISLSDIGRKDSKHKFTASKTGVIRDRPVSNARSVKELYDLATELNKGQSKRMKYIRNLIQDYYSSTSDDARDRIAKKVYSEAEEYREVLEEYKNELKKKNQNEPKKAEK